MPQQRAPQPRVKIHFHKRFYVFAGLLALLFIWFVYSAVKPKSHTLETVLKTQACVLDSPSATPCTPKITAYNYPFASSQESAKFESVVQPIQNNESFYEHYSDNKGIPVTFIAYILPKASHYEVDGYTDSKNIYLPALFITPGEPNAVSSIVQGNSSSTQPPILIGFDKNQAFPAQGTFVRIYGTIWWQSGYERPADTITAATGISNLPIVLAGSYSEYSDIEAEYPATVTQPLELDIQRGGQANNYSLSVKQIEYSSVQTRILVSLTNNSNTQAQGWNGGSETTLNNSGNTISCGSSTQTLNLGTSESVAGIFGNAELAPRESISGFILCGATNPSEKTEIYMPDLPVNPNNTTANRNEVNKIVVTVPPQS